MYKLQKYEYFFQRKTLEFLLKEYPIYLVIDHTKDNIILNKPWEDAIIGPSTIILSPKKFRTFLFRRIKVFGSLLEVTALGSDINPVKCPKGSIIKTTWEIEFSQFLETLYNYGYMNKAIKKVMKEYNIKDFWVPHSIVNVVGDPYNMEDFDWFAIRN